MANETTFALLEGDMAYDYALLAEEIIGARYAYDNVRDLARTKDISSFPSDSARFPLYPALSAGALTDGTDLTTNTAFNPTNATFAVSEVGLKLILTDLGRSGSYLGDSDLAMEACKAVLEKINTDLCALGSGFSSTVGSTGVNLTEQNILDGLITLIGNKTPDDVVCVLHQQQYYDLVADIGTTISSAGSTGATARAETNDLAGNRGGLMGGLYGVDFRMNPLVPTANAGADRAGFMFVRNRAIAMVIKWFIRPEFERDASYRGTETVVTAAYAVGEIEDASGVGVTTDA